MKAPAVKPAVKAAFERMMAAYPARGDNPRTPALVAFARLVEEGEDPESLVRAARHFAQVMKAEKRDARMIPHTRTWLSQRRFDDYVDAPASADTGQPSPDHPLAFMFDEVGAAAWASYFAPLAIRQDADALVIETRTSFALEKIRRAWWDRQIEARLGPVTWRVAA